jgi:hypothetical protein
MPRHSLTAKKHPGRFRPRVEALEDRRLLAQSLFGGAVLKETFDDVVDLATYQSGHSPDIPPGSTFNDYLTATGPGPGGQGTVTTVDTSHSLFRHFLLGGTGSVDADFSGADGNGTTSPIASDRVAADLLLVNHPTDLVSFPDVDSAAEQVSVVNLDVRQGDASIVRFFGVNDYETLTADAPPTGTSSSSSVGGVTETTSPPGPPSSAPANKEIFGPFTVPGRSTTTSWVTLGAASSDIGDNGLTLGPIRFIGLYTGSQGAFDNIRVFVSAIPPHAPPVAGNVQGIFVDENSTDNRIGVLAQASGDTIHLLAPQGGSAQGGTLQLPPSKDVIQYTPPPGYHGPDSFPYTVQDLYGQTARGTVSLMVDTAPVAHPLSVPVPHGQTGSYTAPANSLLTGASDPDGDPLTVTATDGQYGHVTVDPQTGTFTYQRSDGGLITSDSFFYTVSDGFRTASATVTLAPDNQPPNNPGDLAVPVTHDTHGALNIDVLVNDPRPLDPDGDPVTLNLVHLPTAGALTVNSDNTITYTPYQQIVNPDGTLSSAATPDPQGLVRDDTFAYEVLDQYGAASQIATVHIPYTSCRRTIRPWRRITITPNSRLASLAIMSPISTSSL